MYRIIKHRPEDKDKIFFSSDWHVYHDPSWIVPIWEMRGYLNAQDAAEKIISKINERVPSDGTIYFLGDMFLNASDDQCKQWLSEVNCRNIKILWGNHESNMYRIYKSFMMEAFNTDAIEVYPLSHKSLPNVEFMGNHLELQIGKQRIVLNHFPIHSWNNMCRKSWHLHGHQHNADKTRNPEWPINRCLDVSWDWKKDLWAFDEIEDIMSVKTFVTYDHH